MKYFFTGNISRTAVCVVLLSILPATAIVGYNCMQRYQSELAAVHLAGDYFVKTVSARQEQITEVMETLSLNLVRLRDVANADAAASELFRNIVKKSPEYENILLLDHSGNVVASSLPCDGRIDFRNFSFFKRALRRDAFCVGEVARSPFTNKLALFFAVPVRYDGEQRPGVLSVSLNLSRYDETFAGLALPEDASMYILDGGGTLAAAYPKKRDDGALGELLGGELWRGVQNAEDEHGHFMAELKGGESTYVAYEKLFLPGADQPYFYVLYARPEASIYAQAKTLLRRDVVIFSLAALLSIAATLGLCAYTVRRPWRALLAAATRVADGDLSTRVNRQGVGGEIGMLCGEFNAMAEALDRHDKELTAALEYAELSRNAKSEFLANMSHEIRTSMNAILGMAYLVLKTELTPQQKGYVSKLLAAANSLLRVINDILDFSKMEAGKLTMESIGFSLRRIVSNVRSESAARLGEKQLEFKLQISPDVPDYLVGDPLRLSQALMVIVDDVVSRSERGTVSIVCSVLEQGADQVVLQFAVRDASIGLTPVQLADLRELFASEEDVAPTTMDKQRLRLAIASRLFRMMGGRVEVESVFGEGVLFSARISVGYVAGELRDAVRMFEGQKALIVDAGEASRQDLVEILSRFGFQVECTGDLDVARNLLSRAEDSGSPFVVLFVDWRPSVPDMPSLVMDLKKDPGLENPPPAILTTAAGRTELPASLEELEIDALLPKPINESLVFDTLMNILGVQNELPDQEAVPAEPAVSLEGLRVLLVEDNAVNQQIAGEILESEGVRLAVANNGEEALALLTEDASGNVFDLVLMDLQMPKMDGFAATRAIRAKKGFGSFRLPIIAMTAHSDVSEINACYAAGMNDYTGKPIIVDKLFGALRRWLPVRPGQAEDIRDAVGRIRDLVAIADPPSLAALEEQVTRLAPMLHEGRAVLLRATLTEGEPQAVVDMLDELEGVARDILFPEGEL